MPIRVIAYHPGVAMQKLQMYSLNDSTAGDGIRCASCGLTFAIVFPIHDELANAFYRKQLKQLILDDCKRGRHRDEDAMASGWRKYPQRGNRT